MHLAERFDDIDRPPEQIDADPIATPPIRAAPVYAANFNQRPVRLDDGVGRPVNFLSRQELHGLAPWCRQPVQLRP